MAVFTLNPRSKDNYLNQYKKHLQEQEHMVKSNRSIRVRGKSGIEQQESLFLSLNDNEEQELAKHGGSPEKEIIESVDALRMSLDNGFADINDSLYGIQDEIRGLSKMVGHGFSLIAEAQKFMKLYLEQIQYLLRILPNDQKQKAYYIEKGMVYLQNAFLESADSDFYVDALEEFKKAETIEEKDPFALYLIGLIHLSSTNNLDPVKAETYFRKAARYYQAEVSIDKTNYSLSLLKSRKEFFLEISKSLLFAAKACYIQHKFSEASELAAEAWKALPENVKAGFFQSKYLAANDQSAEAAVVLQKVIEQNPYFSKEAFSDSDLILKTEIAGLLEKLEKEAITEAKSQYKYCIDNIVTESIAHQQLHDIALLIDANTFLDARNALDLLSAKQEWVLPKGASINEEGKTEAKISSFEFSGSIVDYIRFERERVQAIPQALTMMEMDKKEKEIAKVEALIIAKEFLVNENKVTLSKEWKYLLISLSVVLPITLIGVGMGNMQNSFLHYIRPIYIVIMYGGCIGVALTAAYLTFKTIFYRVENKENLITIRRQQSNLSILKGSVKELRKRELQN